MLSPTRRTRIVEHGRAKKAVGASSDKVRENVRQYGQSLGATDKEIADILNELGVSSL